MAQQRQTSRRVHATDRAATVTITVGGFASLAAVLGICIYLLWVVLPLVKGGSVERVAQGEALPGAPVAVLHDDYARSALRLEPDGGLALLRTDTGDTLWRGSVLNKTDAEPAAWSITPGGTLLAMGDYEGGLRLGSLRLRTVLLGPGAIAEEDRALAVDGLRGLGGDAAGYVHRFEENGFRRTTVEIELGDPIRLDSADESANAPGAVVAVDHRQDPAGRRVAVVLREDGTLQVSRIRLIRPLGGGTPRVRASSFALERPDAGEPPRWVFATGDGRHALLIWPSGRCDRYALEASRGQRAETVQLVEPGRTVTACVLLNGSQTLAVGDDEGGVRTVFAARSEGADTPDGFAVVEAQRANSTGAPVVSLRPSVQDRMLAIAHEDGTVRLWHASSGKLVASLETGLEGQPTASISPRNDVVYATEPGGRFVTATLDPGHPEFSLGMTFGKVRYEGQAEPLYVYQSSAADDLSEPKLSLVPLVFGTIKATVFAMLFAVPIAVFAALYTSEFLHPNARRVVKPAVEVMASLPSVVLGFIAAMVLAPLVRDVLPAVLLGLVVVPIVMLLGATVWNLVPERLARRRTSLVHLGLVAMAILLGASASVRLGPIVERVLLTPNESETLVLAGLTEPVPPDSVPAWAQGRSSFGQGEIQRLHADGIYSVGSALVRPVPPTGDGRGEEQLRLAREAGLTDASLRRWLDGQYGDAAPGWLLVLLLPVTVAVWGAYSLLLRRRVDRWVALRPRSFAGVADMARVLAVLAASVAATWVLAHALQAVGIDPRDSIFGPFSQRNTLVIAIIMGFAVVPIIYTLSDDALQSVPATLRSASLAAGATPWQTAVRVVLPVAASGVFSACMIGLGRAVGETMIVLMATGNTPEMSWNVFSGLRTLAANIAVELPEAPKGSTHFRVLVLCGLVLFVMTFVINTSAEIMRQYFRRRNAAL